jgi:hypothetical protein
MDIAKIDRSQFKVLFRRFISDYGIIFVLLLLRIFYSVATWNNKIRREKTLQNLS